ncbi:polysaccharide biosynthesis/export family protein [Novosphingobium sp.]|uniref:polysaccharide biosynthesis/export family protein n=1 Tax=Novosphingobium sp. TaxID=1874826 RepID=UPI002FDA8F6F
MRKSIAIILLSTALVGCAAQARSDVQAVDASALAADNKSGEYRLDTGDRVNIVVYGEETLSGEQLVGADGTVTMPLIGNIPARGVTPRELAAKMQTKLADGFFQNPSVTVSMVAYRPFYILGEVNQPGQYEYAVGMTVRDAVARAGGYTYRAQQKQVLLKRAGSEQEVKVRLDKDLPIQPGDTIRIVERYF